MLMMCWFYCIPFAKGFFFAFAPILFLFSLFVLKRGVRQSRPGLRQFAFLLILIAFLKLFTVDFYFLREPLCEIKKFPFPCNAEGFKKFQVTGLVLLTVCSMVLFNSYRSFLHNRKRMDVTPAQVHLPFWSNLSISLVMMLIFWLAAPWAGYLTVGHVPKFFLQIPWQHLAVLNIFVLLVGFWKLEDCSWIYDPTKKTKKHVVNVWTAKDTLWVSLILFLITLAFSYASNDVLSNSLPKGKNAFQTQIDHIGLRDIGAAEFPRPPAVPEN